jgi:hypothetical protein
MKEGGRIPHEYGDQDDDQNAYGEEPAASTKAEHQMQRRFFQNIVVGKCVTIFKLLPRKDKALLVCRDSILADVLDLALDHVDSVGVLDLEGDCAGELRQAQSQGNNRATPKGKNHSSFVVKKL